MTCYILTYIRQTDRWRMWLRQTDRHPPIVHPLTVVKWLHITLTCDWMLMCLQMCCTLYGLYTGGVEAASLRSVQADYSDPLQPAALSSSSSSGSLSISSGSIFPSPPKTRRSRLSHISASCALSLRGINHRYSHAGSLHVPDTGQGGGGVRAPPWTLRIKHVSLNQTLRLFRAGCVTYPTSYIMK